MPRETKMSLKTTKCCLDPLTLLITVEKQLMHMAFLGFFQFFLMKVLSPPLSPLCDILKSTVTTYELPFGKVCRNIVLIQNADHRMCYSTDNSSQLILNLLLKQCSFKYSVFQFPVTVTHFQNFQA